MSVMYILSTEKKGNKNFKSFKKILQEELEF